MQLFGCFNSLSVDQLGKGDERNKWKCGDDLQFLDIFSGLNQYVVFDV